MTKSPVKGNELYGLFQDFNPFDSNLRLKPRDERRTILAANANFPFGLQIPAFMKAVSSDGGSPVMIQFSGGALAVAGRGIGPALSTTGQPQEQSRSFSYIEALRNGAKLAVAVCKTYIDTYNPPFVALALDHFAVPDPQGAGVSLEISQEPSENRSKEVQAYLVSRKDAVAMLNQAWDFASRYRVPEPGPDDFEGWLRYLTSFAYAQAVAGFIACLEEMSPAWAMLDTEEMPPVLNYAVTRQVCDLVKERGFNTMIEAEYGSTGQAGKSEGYVKLYGDELHGFARQVAGFVKYTGARGISYPIGMEHAAPSGEKHEPDVERLEAVQREIIKESGYYAPFAQHGGTGAKQLARGLVAKNNINTYFLVTMAQHLLGHFSVNQESVRQGKKAACSSNIYISASESVSTAVVGKLKEAGTYGWFGGTL